MGYPLPTIPICQVVRHNSRPLQATNRQIPVGSKLEVRLMALKSKLSILALTSLPFCPSDRVLLRLLSCSTSRWFSLTSPHNTSLKRNKVCRTGPQSQLTITAVGESDVVITKTENGFSSCVLPN